MNFIFKYNTYAFSSWFTYKFPHPSFQLETKIQQLQLFNTCFCMRLERNFCHFSKCIWKYVSWNGISWHFASTFTDFFPGDSISHVSTLWHVKICQKASDEPIFEPMTTRIFASSGPRLLNAMKQFEWTRLQHIHVLRNSICNDVLWQYREILTSKCMFCWSGLIITLRIERLSSYCSYWRSLECTVLKQ